MGGKESGREWKEERGDRRGSVEKEESKIREKEGVKERGEVMTKGQQEKRKCKGERGKCRWGKKESGRWREDEEHRGRREVRYTSWKKGERETTLNTSNSYSSSAHFASRFSIISMNCVPGSVLASSFMVATSVAVIRFKNESMWERRETAVCVGRKGGREGWEGMIGYCVGNFLQLNKILQSDWSISGSINHLHVYHLWFNLYHLWCNWNCMNH